MMFLSSGHEKCVVVVVVVVNTFCIVTSGTVEDYGRLMQV